LYEELVQPQEDLVRNQYITLFPRLGDKTEQTCKIHKANLAAACLHTAEECYYVVMHHFACGIEMKKRRHPSKQAVASSGMSQLLYLHKLSQLLQVAGIC